MELARCKAEVTEVIARLVVVALARVVLPVTFSVPPTAVLPVLSMVVEAVPPKDAVLPVERTAKNEVDDAFARVAALEITSEYVVEASDTVPVEVAKLQ